MTGRLGIVRDDLVRPARGTCCGGRGKVAVADDVCLLSRCAVTAVHEVL